MQAARQSRLRSFCRVPSHDRCSDKYCHDTQRCQAYDGWRVPAEFGVNSRNNDGLGFDCCPLLFRAHAGRPGGVWSRGLCWAVVWHRPALSGACVLAGTRRSRTRRHYQGPSCNADLQLSGGSLSGLPPARSRSYRSALVARGDCPHAIRDWLRPRGVEATCRLAVRSASRSHGC